MALKVFNSLTRKKEDFVTEEEGKDEKKERSRIGKES